MAELIAHMDTHTANDVDAWVFTAANGGPAREAPLRDAWMVAAKASGVPAAYFHDLRHFGGTTAAQSGATTRELQGRLGHATTRAAMIYQHRSDDRDRDIADRMGDALSRGIEDRNERNSKAQTHPEPIAQTAG
jgi:integrase